MNTGDGDLVRLNLIRTESGIFSRLCEGTTLVKSSDSYDSSRIRPRFIFIFYFIINNYVKTKRERSLLMLTASIPFMAILILNFRVKGQLICQNLFLPIVLLEIKVDKVLFSFLIESKRPQNPHLCSLIMRDLIKPVRAPIPAHEQFPNLRQDHLVIVMLHQTFL